MRLCVCVCLCVCVFPCLVHALSRSIPATECRNGIRGAGKHVAHHVQTHKDLLRSDVSRACHRKLQEKDWQIQTTPSHSDNYLQSRPEGQTLGDGMTVISKTIEIQRQFTPIFMNGRNCNAQYGRIVPPSKWKSQSLIGKVTASLQQPLEAPVPIETWGWTRRYDCACALAGLA